MSEELKPSKLDDLEMAFDFFSTAEGSLNKRIYAQPYFWIPKRFTLE